MNGKKTTDSYDENTSEATDIHFFYQQLKI